MKIIDPYSIHYSDLPMVVFSDDIRGFIPWAIKARTNGSYNHVMWMTDPGYFISQGLTYKEIPMEKYMTKKHRLKFWSLATLGDQNKSNIQRHINDKRDQPWWKNLYDFPGILGQAIGVRWFNLPWKEFCSEDIARGLRVVPFLRKVIIKAPSPSWLNKEFKQIPEIKYFGHYMYD